MPKMHRCRKHPQHFEKRNMNILAIGAHPDDIEFGCGGSLIKFVERGHSVFLLVMTKGGMGGSPETRVAEQIDSAAVIGATRIFWGGYEDTYLKGGKTLIEKIEDTIKQVSPTFIFCHFPDDTHQDHRHLARATVTATRYIRNVLYYEGPTTQNFNPQVYVDISEALEKKMRSLQAHASQITKTNIEGNSIIDLVCACAKFRGIQGRVKCAEAFHTTRLFINI